MKKYSVVIKVVGNPDFGQNPNSNLGIPTQTIYKDSIEELQTSFRAFIRKNNLGGGNVPSAKVYCGKEYIGKISYNGRFWDKED